MGRILREAYDKQVKLVRETGRGASRYRALPSLTCVSAQDEISARDRPSLSGVLGDKVLDGRGRLATIGASLRELGRDLSSLASRD